MGAWATGTAAVFLSDSAGTDGGAAGSGRVPPGWAPARSPTHWRRRRPHSASRSEPAAEVVEIRNRGTRAIGVTLADGTELNAPLIVSAADPKRTAALCDPVTLGPTMVWRDGQHPPAGRDRAGEPRVVGAAGVPRRRRRAARRPDRARSVDRRRRAGDGRGEVRARERGAAARGDDPVAHRSVARARGQARDERRVPGRALRAPRRRLGERARPGRRHRDQGARGRGARGSASSSRRAR